MTIGEKKMKPHESPRIKKSIRGDSGESWPVWNRGINRHVDSLVLCLRKTMILGIVRNNLPDVD